jgi:RimJ/RimL family protein N-acetyltransferase
MEDVTTPVLETPRLLLKPLALEDAEAVQALFAHWEIVRYLNGIVPWPYPPDGALTYFRDIALPAIARGDEWIGRCASTPTRRRSSARSA